jgi:hypothetical protein
VKVAGTHSGSSHARGRVAQAHRALSPRSTVAGRPLTWSPHGKILKTTPVP